MTTTSINGHVLLLRPQDQRKTKEKTRHNIKQTEGSETFLHTTY
jgi:hypothetical protein